MAELRGQILIKAASAKVYAAIAIRVGFGHRWTADSKTEDKVGGECPETGRPLPGFLSSQEWTEPQALYFSLRFTSHWVSLPRTNRHRVFQIAERTSTAFPNSRWPADKG